MELEQNGTGVVYVGADCGPGYVKSIQNGGTGEESSCSDTIIHHDLITIVWDVLKACEEDANATLYGFNVHNWTIEELHEAYKTKTGSDFTPLL